MDKLGSDKRGGRPRSDRSRWRPAGDCQQFRVSAMTMGGRNPRMARRKPPIIPDELLDQLLAGRDPQAALGRDGLVDELKRALAERALNAEMDHHLDGEAAEGRGNSRNGYGRKTLLTDSGKLPISVPRDPGPFGRPLRSRRLAGPDQRRDRRHPGRDCRMAEPAARTGLPPGVLRR